METFQNFLFVALGTRLLVVEDLVAVILGVSLPACLVPFKLRHQKTSSGKR